MGLAFGLALGRYGIDFVGRVTVTTPVLELPQSWAYSCLPITGGLMALYALRDLVLSILRSPASGSPEPKADVRRR